MYEESKNIISVCVVRGEDNFINRIADVCENELVVPEIDRSNNFGKGFNRDRLFYDIQKEPFHLENVRHTPCYTSFFQRIQAKAR